VWSDRDRRTERPFDDVTQTLDEKHYRAVDQLCEEIEKVLERRPGINFINNLRARFLYEIVFFSYILAKKHFCMKNARIKC